jgi:hypothetical protein
MILTIFERYALFTILPREGNFQTLKTIKNLRESLSLTDEEKELYEFHQEDDGKVYWKLTDDEGNQIPQEVDVDISIHGMSIIRDTLEKLDKQDQLKEELYTVYEKFVEG